METTKDNFFDKKASYQALVADGDDSSLVNTVSNINNNIQSKNVHFFRFFTPNTFRIKILIK